MGIKIEGNLKDIDFLYLLSLFRKVKHTGKLIVASGEEEGIVFVENGEIKFAKFNKEEGFSALLKIAKLEEGMFKFDDKAKTDKRHFLDEENILEKLKKELNSSEPIKNKGNKVIKLIPKVNSNIVLNPIQWRIIALSQGCLTLKEISKELKVSEEEVVNVAEALESLGIVKLEDKEAFIEPAKFKEKTYEKRVPSVFWKNLEKELTVYVGPIAQSMIEDEIEYMGENKKTFSFGKLPILIERLSKEIDNSNNRLKFQKKMLDILKRL